MDNQFYFHEEIIKNLSNDFFSSYDAHVRAGSKDEFKNDIITAMNSGMRPAFSMLLHHAIEVNEDILDCSFIPPDTISPLHFGELSDIIFTEMVKENKTAYYLLKRLKELFASEPNYYMFPAVLKLWRAAVFSGNRQYFDLMISFLSEHDLLKKALHDHAVIFYLIRNDRREELSEIADIIGIDELLSKLNLLPAGIILPDNYSLMYYIEYLFDLFIPEYRNAFDKDRVFCRLFEKYNMFEFLTKISRSGNIYSYIFEYTDDEKINKQKIMRMTITFLHDLAAKGYVMSSKGLEDLIIQVEYNFWNMIICNENVLSELKAILPDKPCLSYTSEVFCDGFYKRCLDKITLMHPIQPIIVFDESTPDFYSSKDIFCNFLHKDLNTLKKTFESIKTAIEGDMEKIPVINEIIERNDDAVIYLLDSLEDPSDEIISGLAELCVKKGCVTTLSHISKYTAERKRSL
ncbi:MAG: hypothetical protein J6K92_03055 [Oscillospiraceae bacterium]|nr:hypothetical protein [Oscillospiraceae bacterium]